METVKWQRISVFHRKSHTVSLRIFKESEKQVEKFAGDFFPLCYVQEGCGNAGVTGAQRYSLRNKLNICMDNKN